MGWNSSHCMEVSLYIQTHTWGEVATLAEV